MIKPKAVKNDDTIAVIAPSRHVKGFEKDIKDGIKIIEKHGFKVLYANSLSGQHGNTSGEASVRAEEFMLLVEDPKVNMIWAALGGDSCNQILPLLDYKKIASNPKIILGYSDITTLLLAICHKSNLMTYHGPNVKDLALINHESSDFLFKLVASADEEMRYPKFSVIRHGQANGRLLGGNLFIVNSLLTTPFSPDYDQSILFIEDIEEGMHTFEYQIYQLKNSGLLDRIKGLIIGHIDQWDERKSPIASLVSKISGGIDIPIILTDYFGHHSKAFYTMPLGATAHLNTREKIFKIN